MDVHVLFATCIQVEITHHVAYKHTTCTQATINTGTLTVSALRCQRGCIGSIGSSRLNCTDFMTSDTWNTGEQSYTHTFSGTESYFEAS